MDVAACGISAVPIVSGIVCPIPCADELNSQHTSPAYRTYEIYSLTNEYLCTVAAHQQLLFVL